MSKIGAMQRPRAGPPWSEYLERPGGGEAPTVRRGGAGDHTQAS